MKVVINTKMEGLNLSHAAVMRYCRLKGIEIYSQVEKISGKCEKTDDPYNPEIFVEYFTDPGRGSGARWDEEDIERHDPALIQVVEEMEEKANSKYAEFQIIEIPDGMDYVVEHSEGGSEWIAQAHPTWGPDGRCFTPNPPSRPERMKALLGEMRWMMGGGEIKKPEPWLDSTNQLQDAIATEERNNAKEGE